MLFSILPLSQRSRSVALHIPVAAGSRSLAAKGGENMRSQRKLARFLDSEEKSGAWGLVRTIDVTDGGLDVRLPGSFSRWFPMPRHGMGVATVTEGLLLVHSRVISGRARRRWVGSHVGR